MSQSKSGYGWIIIIAIVGLAIWGVIAMSNKTAESFDKLAVCLADSGATFYGSFECSHCQQQKGMFGKAVKQLPYVECGPLPRREGQAWDNEECVQAGVQGVPHWTFANGQTLVGTQSLEDLATQTGCEAALEKAEAPVDVEINGETVQVEVTE